MILILLLILMLGATSSCMHKALNCQDVLAQFMHAFISQRSSIPSAKSTCVKDIREKNDKTSKV